MCVEILIEGNGYLFKGGEGGGWGGGGGQLCQNCFRPALPSEKGSTPK